MAGRPGRDAKWKGGTGLKAEMGNEGSSSSSNSAAATQQQDAPLLLLLLLLEPTTSKKLTEIWRKNFKSIAMKLRNSFLKCTQMHAETLGLK